MHDTRVEHVRAYIEHKYPSFTSQLPVREVHVYKRQRTFYLSFTYATQATDVKETTAVRVKTRFSVVRRKPDKDGKPTCIQSHFTDVSFPFCQPFRDRILMCTVQFYADNERFERGHM